MATGVGQAPESAADAACRNVILASPGGQRRLSMMASRLNDGAPPKSAQFIFDRRPSMQPHLQSRVSRSVFMASFIAALSALASGQAAAASDGSAHRDHPADAPHQRHPARERSAQARRTARQLDLRHPEHTRLPPRGHRSRRGRSHRLCRALAALARPLISLPLLPAFSAASLRRACKPAEHEFFRASVPDARFFIASAERHRSAGFHPAVRARKH